MATSADPTLLDTSAAIALVRPDQQGHHDALARLRITGGSVYDALVGAVAVEQGLRLISLDRRAEPVYLALGVDLELL